MGDDQMIQALLGQPKLKELYQSALDLYAALPEYWLVGEEPFFVDWQGASYGGKKPFMCLLRAGDSNWHFMDELVLLAYYLTQERYSAEERAEFERMAADLIPEVRQFRAQYGRLS